MEFKSVSTTFRPISFRPLHRKQSLHWKQVGYFTGNATSLEMAFKLTIHFTGKYYFIRNGIQPYNPLHRKL